MSNACPERPGPVAVPAPEPGITFTVRDRLEPGEYPAYCRSAKTIQERVFQRWKCVVQFDLRSPDLLRVIGRVTWFLNLGSRDKPHAGMRGKFWEAWIKANGGPPKRGDRLSPRVFQGRMATIVIRDVETNHRDRKSRLDPSLFYSVVKEVKSWQTGPT